VRNAAQCEHIETMKFKTYSRGVESIYCLATQNVAAFWWEVWR